MVGLITAFVILMDTYALPVGAYLLNHMLLWQLNKYFHLRCLQVFAVAPFTSISYIQWEIITWSLDPFQLESRFYNFLQLC